MLCVRGGEHDVVKVLDFGLVKDLRNPAHARHHAVLEGARARRSSWRPSACATPRTRTPAPTSTRSARSRYFALAGRAAFEAQSDHDIVYRVLNESAAPLEAAVAPPVLGALVARCLEKDRTLRPASADEVLAVLDAVAAQWPWTEAEARAWWEGHRARGAAAV